MALLQEVCCYYYVDRQGRSNFYGSFFRRSSQVLSSLSKTYLSLSASAAITFNLFFSCLNSRISAMGRVCQLAAFFFTFSRDSLMLSQNHCRIKLTSRTGASALLVSTPYCLKAVIPSSKLSIDTISLAIFSWVCVTLSYINWNILDKSYKFL